MKDININELRNDTVHVQPRMVDWQEALGDDYEGFQCFESVECGACSRAVVTSVVGAEEHQVIEPEITVKSEYGDEVDESNYCEGEISGEGPMMNFFYPLEISEYDEAAKAINGLPLCVIVFEDGETGLALTGGGMDLSWEICEAYIRLGCLPPVHFELPSMAGRGVSERDRLIMKACRRSADVAMEQARRKRDRLDERLG